jgi:hypothetical protein
LVTSTAFPAPLLPSTTTFNGATTGSSSMVIGALI